MKKLLLLILMAGLLVSSAVSASTLLTGKSHQEIYKNIVYVDGTGEKEQSFEGILKVVAMEPMPSFGLSEFINVNPHENPDCHMYYFRAKGGMLFGFQTLNMVFGVDGIQIKIENLTDKPMTIHWDKSLIQIGGTISMPHVDKAKFDKDGWPETPPDTIIGPKSAVIAKLLSSVNKMKWSAHEWRHQPVPISDDGSTRIIVTLNVEHEGAEKEYSYTSPCLDFPTDYLAVHKASNKDVKK